MGYRAMALPKGITLSFSSSAPRFFKKSSASTTPYGGVGNGKFDTWDARKIMIQFIYYKSSPEVTEKAQLLTVNFKLSVH